MLIHAEFRMQKISLLMSVTSCHLFFDKVALTHCFSSAILEKTRLQSANYTKTNRKLQPLITLQFTEISVLLHTS